MHQMIKEKKHPDGLTVVDPHKITRDRMQNKIYGRPQPKRYRLVNTKRVFGRDYKSRPYGYRSRRRRN